MCINTVVIGYLLCLQFTRMTFSCEDILCIQEKTMKDSDVMLMSCFLCHVL